MESKSRLPCVIIDGRHVEWNDFGALLMAFEGWQIMLELQDLSDEAGFRRYCPALLRRRTSTGTSVARSV